MGRRANGTGSVFKDAQGYWNAQIPIGKDSKGKTKFKKFRSKKQATVLTKMKEYQLLHGTDAPQSYEKITIEEYLKNYLFSIKKDTIKPKSFDSVYNSYSVHIAPRIGHYYLTELTSEEIQTELISDMINSGYAYSTIHKSYILINECLNYAVAQDKIIKNPCINVRLPKKENFNSKDIRFLSDDEIARFKESALIRQKDKYIYKYGNIITLVIYTGLRLGELNALKWEDVDIDKRLLSVNKNIISTEDKKNGGNKRILIEQKGTKNGKCRIIQLNSKAIEILNRQKELVGDSDPASYIVSGRTKITDNTTISRCYKEICKRAEIPDCHSIHSLRHTFASLALRRGVDVKIVSEILGHSSVAFTYNTYVHILDEQKYSAVRLLEDL